jgi:hypothetical protein
MLRVLTPVEFIQKLFFSFGGVFAPKRKRVYTHFSKCRVPYLSQTDYYRPYRSVLINFDFSDVSAQLDASLVLIIPDKLIRISMSPRWDVSLGVLLNSRINKYDLSLDFHIFPK